MKKTMKQKPGLLREYDNMPENDCEKQVIVQAKGHIDVQSMVQSQEELEENQQDDTNDTCSRCGASRWKPDTS